LAGENPAPASVTMQPSEGMQKKSEAAPVSFKKDIKEEWEALKKRVSYLEAELAKRDAKIRDLEAK
jgi:hypothetical protein